MNSLDGNSNLESEISDLKPASTAPLWPSLLLCLVLATLINLGSSHRRLTADAACPVLTSLYCWTPFYWETIRFGQLLALLAMPFKNPLTNLLVQSEMSDFSALASIFLFTRYLQKGPYWPLTAAALWLLALLALPSESLGFFMTTGQCYGPALALTAGGLILLEDFPGWRRAPGRLAAAILVLALAHWINSATAILLVPFLALRFVCGKQITFKECAAGVLVNCGTFAALFAVGQLNRVLMFQYEDPLFPFTFSPPQEWPEKWLGVLRSLRWASGHFIPILGTALLLPVLAALRASPGRKALADAWKPLAPPILAGIFYALLMSTLRWVLGSGNWICRYSIPSICLILSAIAAVCWNSLWPALLRQRSAFALTGCTAMALIAVTLTTYGRPSVANVRRDLDGACGNLTEGLRATGCTHLAGEYWAVWPVMFHANLVAYERGEPAGFWGVTYRSTELQPHWREVPVQNLKLAIIRDSPHPHHYTSAFHLDGMTQKDYGGFKTAIPPEVFLVWARGFYEEERSEGNLFRWARQKAELWVCNRTTVPQQVQLDMQFRRDQGSAAGLRITSDWFEHELQVSGEETSLTRTFLLPPGWHTIDFQCDGSRVVPEDTGRWLVFRVLNARVSPTSSASPDAGSPSSGDSRREHLATRPDVPPRK